MKSYHVLNSASHCEDVWESGHIASHILNLGTRWKWVVSFKPRPLYAKVKSPRCLTDRTLDGPQSLYGRGGEEKRSQPVPIRSLVTVMTELFISKLSHLLWRFHRNQNLCYMQSNFTIRETMADQYKIWNSLLWFSTVIYFSFSWSSGSSASCSLTSSISVLPIERDTIMFYRYGCSEKGSKLYSKWSRAQAVKYLRGHYINCTEDGSWLCLHFYCSSQQWRGNPQLCCEQQAYKPQAKHQNRDKCLISKAEFATIIILIFCSPRTAYDSCFPSNASVYKIWRFHNFMIQPNAQFPMVHIPTTLTLWYITLTFRIMVVFATVNM